MNTAFLVYQMEKASEAAAELQKRGWASNLITAGAGLAPIVYDQLKSRLGK